MSKKKKEVLFIKGGIVEDVSWREITFTCPVRGKVTQRVQVKKIKSVLPESKHVIRSGDLLGDYAVSEISDLIADDEDILLGGDV